MIESGSKDCQPFANGGLLDCGGLTPLSSWLAMSLKKTVGALASLKRRQAAAVQSGEAPQFKNTHMHQQNCGLDGR